MINKQIVDNACARILALAPSIAVILPIENSNKCAYILSDPEDVWNIVKNENTFALYCSNSELLHYFNK